MTTPTRKQNITSSGNNQLFKPAIRLAEILEHSENKSSAARAVNVNNLFSAKKKRFSLEADFSYKNRTIDADVDFEERHWEAKYHDLVDDYANYRVKYQLEKDDNQL